MSEARQAYFDLKTVAYLREVLDDAWASLSAEERANTARSLLAERILKTAAKGERDRARLIEAAVRRELAA